MLFIAAYLFGSNALCFALQYCEQRTRDRARGRGERGKAAGKRERAGYKKKGKKEKEREKEEEEEEEREKRGTCMDTGEGGVGEERATNRT